MTEIEFCEKYNYAKVECMCCLLCKYKVMRKCTHPDAPKGRFEMLVNDKFVCDNFEGKNG